MDARRRELLAPLGSLRLRVLACLGGHDPRVPGYFDVAEDVDVLAAFRAYVERLAQRWASERDPVAVSLLAAGRLLAGDLSAAATILDHLPAQAFALDHGAGICVVVPLHALSAALPLPEDLRDTRQWVAGAPQPRALRAWLDDHRAELRWIDGAGVYRLAAA